MSMLILEIIALFIELAEGIANSHDQSCAELEGLKQKFGWFRQNESTYQPPPALDYNLSIRHNDQTASPSNFTNISQLFKLHEYPSRSG